jgi:hypothetical protein
VGWGGLPRGREESPWSCTAVAAAAAVAGRRADVGSGDGGDRCAEYGDLGLACVLGFRGEAEGGSGEPRGTTKTKGRGEKKWIGGARGFPTVKKG